MPLIPLIAAILVAITGAVGGTALVADGSVPGDTLYPIKIELNETVRDVFAVSDEAQAEWEIRKAERRLEEVEELSIRGDKDSLSKVEENFDKHLEKANELKEKLTGNEDFQNAVDVQNKIESSLAAHERIFDKIRFELETEEEKIKITDIIKKLQTKMKEMRLEGVNLEEKEFKSKDVVEASEGKLKSLENKIEETEKFVEKNSDNLSEDILKIVTDRISKIKNSVFVMAKDKIENKNYREGFKLYQQGIRELQEVKKIIQTSDRLEIEKKVRERREDRVERNRGDVEEVDDIENGDEIADEDSSDKNDEEGELEDEDNDKEDAEDRGNRVRFENGAVEFETAN